MPCLLTLELALFCLYEIHVVVSEEQLPMQNSLKREEESFTLRPALVCHYKSVVLEAMIIRD